MSDSIDFGGAPWQAIPRAVLRDDQLTPKAKGGLVTLLSHEEGWVRSVIGILRRENAGLGREGAQAIMRELVEQGYAVKTTTRGKDGKFVTSYVVRPTRESARSEPGTVASPRPVNPATVEPVPVNPAAVVEPLEGEPLDEEPQTVDLAPSARNESIELIGGDLKRRQDIFEVLFFVETSMVYGEETSKTLTASARGTLNKAVKEVADTGISPGELVQCISQFPNLGYSVTCTPMAVAKNLSRLRALAAGVVQPPSNGYHTESVAEMTAKALQLLEREEEEASWQ